MTQDALMNSTGCSYELPVKCFTATIPSINVSIMPTNSTQLSTVKLMSLFKKPGKNSSMLGSFVCLSFVCLFILRGYFLFSMIYQIQHQTFLFQSFLPTKLEIHDRMQL